MKGQNNPLDTDDDSGSFCDYPIVNLLAHNLYDIAQIIVQERNQIDSYNSLQQSIQLNSGGKAFEN